MAVGIITKIETGALFIDGKRQNYKGKDLFCIGDKIEFQLKKGNIRNISLYNPEEENKIEEIQEVQNENNNISEVEKIDSDNQIDIKKLMLIDEKFRQTEKIDKLVRKIKYDGLKNAQFSTFENELNKFNYNLISKDLLKFIDGRIDRNRAIEFYKSIKIELIENLQIIEDEFGIGEFEPKYKNMFMRKLFVYMKKYYRYQNIIAEKKGEKSEF